MDKLDWLWLSGAAVWIGFGLYLARLARRQTALERRLSVLAAERQPGRSGGETTPDEEA